MAQATFPYWTGDVWHFAPDKGRMRLSAMKRMVDDRIAFLTKEREQSGVELTLKSDGEDNHGNVLTIDIDDAGVVDWHVYIYDINKCREAQMSIDSLQASWRRMHWARGDNTPILILTRESFDLSWAVTDAETMVLLTMTRTDLNFDDLSLSVPTSWRVRLGDFMRAAQRKRLTARFTLLHFGLFDDLTHMTLAFLYTKWTS